MGEISGGRGDIPGITTLPGEITGSGTANKVAKFTGAQSIGNSSITDDGATVLFTIPIVAQGTAPQEVVRQVGGVAGTNETQVGQAATVFTIQQKDTGGMVFIVPSANQLFNFSRAAATNKSVILSDNGNGGYFQINNATNLLCQILGDDGTGQMSLKGVSGMQILWRDNASTIGAGSDDTGLKRSGVGGVKVTNGSTGVGYIESGGVIAGIVTKTANYTATATDHTILCDATGGAFTITLPAAASHTGRIYAIKKIDASVNAVTIDGNASETIDGALTQVIATQYTNLQIQSDGANWWII